MWEEPEEPVDLKQFSSGPKGKFPTVTRGREGSMTFNPPPYLQSRARSAGTCPRAARPSVHRSFGSEQLAGGDMEEFLSNCQRAVEADPDPAGPPVHVVLGNEACDVDSMVSALVYAYFLSRTGGDGLTVPVLNIRGAELALRSDNLFLLRQTGLSPELLVFRDGLDLPKLLLQGRLRLTLVDHNVLPSSDGDLEGVVVEVIDHHLLERDPSSSCSITVETVGSCATLVTERILQRAPQILDAQLAQLLYAAILLDCVNMAPAAGKVTPKDSQYAAALEARFPSLPPRTGLFQALNNAKFDVSGLSTEQMLMKDMKVVSGSWNLAVSVLYIPLEDFLVRGGVEAELSSFCQRLGLELLLLMTISFTESRQPIRELAVFSGSPSCREQVSRYLEKTRNPALDLCPISCPHPLITAYHQGNSLASRKKLLPIIKDFLQERAGCQGNIEDDEEEEEEGVVPPTPMNSLVEGCPLDAGPPQISARDLQEKFSKMAADL